MNKNNKCLQMNRKRSNIVFFILMISSFSGTLFSSCEERSKKGMILFTQVPGDLQDINYITGNSWRYIADSRIVALNPNEQGESLKVLTEGFFSACSPEISYDGKFMLFAAQKKQNDIWQIWEMNLNNLKVRKITSSNENCIDPAYLPGGRVVFSKLSTYNTANKEHSLFTCNINGSDIKQITFNPNVNFASTVLHDGRILTISKQLYPDQRNGIFMVLRPDGTKEELFYKGLKGSNILSRAYETKNGKIIFIESDKNNEGRANLISIDYNRPEHSRIDLSTNIAGDFHTISPMKGGKLLVSYRTSDDHRYALYEFDHVNNILGNPIYKNTNYNAIEAVVVEKKERPKNIPSEVDMNFKTGLMLCQDINFSYNQNNTSSTSKAVRMEVMGIDTTLGIVDVEKDGSVYLKIIADTPFQLQTLDEAGKVVSGPSSWIYLRPNERRGCVGCHQGNERVPENRQPLSVLKAPVEIPKHFNKIVENR
jgi:Hydrazine synthase alpha subunit middle domain